MNRRSLRRSGVPSLSNRSTAGSPFAISGKRARNLVIVRAGDSSLHESWLAGPEARDWDLVAIYFGDNPSLYRSDEYVRMDAAGPYAKGPKWPNVHDFVRQWNENILQYDFVWFPDDDLAAAKPAINQMFALCAELQLELAQPALSFDSYISHPITLVNKSFLVRYTNFVEIMAPVFSRAFLQRCVSSFTENLSGHGLDHLWPIWASAPYKLGILDACPIRHTRPVGGPTYQVVAAAGRSAGDELAELLKKYKLNPATAIFGGIDREGRKLLLSEGHGCELVEAILKGYLPEFAHNSRALNSLLQPILRYMTISPAPAEAATPAPPATDRPGTKQRHAISLTEEETRAMSFPAARSGEQNVAHQEPQNGSPLGPPITSRPSGQPLIVRYQLLGDDTSGLLPDKARVAELVCSLTSIKLYVQPHWPVRIVLYTLPQHRARLSGILECLGFSDFLVLDVIDPEDQAFADSIVHGTAIDRFCVRRMLTDFRVLPVDSFRLLLGTDCYFFRPPSELFAFLSQACDAQVLYMVDNLTFAGELYRLRYFDGKILNGLLGDCYCLGPSVTLDGSAIRACLRMIESWPPQRRWVPDCPDLNGLVHACEQQAAAILLAQFPARQLPASAYHHLIPRAGCTLVHAHAPWTLMQRSCMPRPLQDATLQNWQNLGLTVLVPQPGQAPSAAAVRPSAWMATENRQR